MSHKVLFHAALIVLAFAVLLTGCRRSTPIVEPPPPEPPAPVEPVDPEPPEDPDIAPSFAPGLETLSYSYPVGVRIFPRILPEAAGGDGALTYTLGEGNEVLPPGMAYVESHRALVGTPQVEGDYELTYRAVDADDNLDPSDSAVLKVVISVGPAIPVSALLAAVNVGDTEGVLVTGPPPEANDGPSVESEGNNALVSGGAIFVAVEADADLAKLLLSVDMQSYYEIDLAAAMAPYRFTGHVMPGIEEYSPLCLSVMGVGADGTVGEAECHPLFVVPEIGTGDLEIAVSWDTDADLDLHVVDANGQEVYWGREMVDSGGELDLESGTDCFPDGVRTEHIAWTGGTPPPGTYVVRVNYWSDCGFPETNYVVNVTLNGERTSFYGTFEGPGEEDGGRGSGEVIDIFTIPGDGPPPALVPSISAAYRGSGDQVFVLNPEGEELDDTLVTLDLGATPAEVYVIASNTAHYPMEPQVERLDLMEATIKAGRFAYKEEYEAQPRPPAAAFAPAPDEPPPVPSWITEFNNNPPLTGGGSIGKGASRLLQQSGQGVAEGDMFTFLHYAGGDAIPIPATARRVITDGTVTLGVWVADENWEGICDTTLGLNPPVCLTQEMVDAVADSFLRPGTNNDIYDWVSTAFGDPWGPHPLEGFLIPAEAAGEIHILLLEIPFALGFFFGKDTVIRNPDHPLFRTSNERLMFYIDAEWLATAEGSTWEITDRLPSQAITTLAHEFQHLIHFYQKPILRDTSSETWLNEMSSEVAEDLVNDKIGVIGPRGLAHDDPTAGEPGITRGRMPLFNLYNDLQVTRWDGDIANYSINYAMGAYLARTYGGAALFSAIVQSDQAGVDAVDAALQSLGHDASFGQALADWGTAVVLSDNTDAPVPYRYNTGDWRYSRNGGVEYRLGSINLFNYVLELRNVTRLRWEGLYLHSLESLSETTLEPHSNKYVFLGRNSGTIRLNVSAVTDNRITVVVKE